MLDGYYQTITTKDKSKAKGLTINYKVPRSFELKEGDRPNSVFRNSNSKDFFVVLVINDLIAQLAKEGIEFTTKEKEMFSSY